jgi:hypothetical protein
MESFYNLIKICYFYFLLKQVYLKITIPLINFLMYLIQIVYNFNIIIFNIIIFNRVIYKNRANNIFNIINSNLNNFKYNLNNFYFINKKRISIKFNIIQNTIKKYK